MIGGDVTVGVGSTVAVGVGAGVGAGVGDVVGFGRGFFGTVGFFTGVVAVGFAVTTGAVTVGVATGGVCALFGWPGHSAQSFVEWQSSHTFDERACSGFFAF